MNSQNQATITIRGLAAIDVQVLEAQIKLALASHVHSGADPEECLLTVWDYVAADLPPHLTKEEQLTLVRSLLRDGDGTWPIVETEPPLGITTEPLLPASGEIVVTDSASSEIPESGDSATSAAGDADSAQADPELAPFTPAMALASGRSIIPTGMDKKPFWDLLPKRYDPEDGKEKPTWMPFQERLATPEEFEMWNRANPPGYAFATGTLSGIVTFDYDDEEGQELARKHGIRPHRKTPGGGLHLDVYHPGFRVPTLNGKATRKLRRRFPGLDVRGDGGYAVAFGRSSDGFYAWLRAPEPDPVDVIPAEVWDFLRDARQRDVDPNKPGTSDLSGESTSVAPKAGTATGKITVGNRHAALISHAGMLGNLKANGTFALSEKQIAAAVRVWDRENCDPPKNNPTEIAAMAKYVCEHRGSAIAEPCARAVSSLKPDPLPPEAFYGVAGEFVRIVEPHSEADPAALLIQLIVVAGVFLGRNAYYQVESTKHYPNLNTIIVGETSQGRKGTSYGRVRAVFERADPEFAEKCFASGLSSGEGLIWRVRNPITEIRFKKGGIEGVPVVVDPGIADKRLCVTESEFSRVLKVASGQTNILMDVIRDAWDTGNLDNLTKNSRTRATGAHIGIVGHITKEEVTKLLTCTEAANGFANRFLWVYSTRSKSLPFGGNLPPDALDGLREALGIAEANTYPGQPALAFDEEAAALWDGGGAYEALSAGQPGLVGALLGRAAPHVVRLALIFALLDLKHSISLAHLKAALAIWRYSEASARFVFGESLGDETADEIWRFLRTVGPAGATRTEISKLFSRNKSSAEIGRALETLARHSRAYRVIEQTGGAPAERWFICKV
jgi:hypothetical protein